jgi:hypothetical protein
VFAKPPAGLRNLAVSADQAIRARRDQDIGRRWLFSWRPVINNVHDNVVNRVGYLLCRNIEVVREDGERDLLASIGGGIPGEGFHATQRARLPINSALGNCATEPFGKRAVHSRQRKRLAEIGSPGLP